MDAVSVVKCPSYELNVVDKALKESLSLIGGLKIFVKKKDKVLVKPNLLAGHPPERVVTTHPAIVEKVIEMLLELGATPTVGDSPGGRSALEVAEKAQIKGVCDRLKVPLIGLSNPHWVKSRGRLVEKFPISKRLRQFDAIVNLPKLKTHAFTVYTGAVKNIFGCIPGKAKSSFHLHYQTRERFSEMLLELHDVIQPTLTIMDAIVGMEGYGPSYGNPRHIGLILAGENALAVDCVATHIVGFEKRTPLIKVAQKLGMEQAFLSNVDVKGETIKDVRLRDFKGPRFDTFVDALRSQSMKLLRRNFALRPIVDIESCIACGQCAEVCPVDAIFIDKKAVINSRKCIRCYCCYEVCPHKAIKLKRLI